MKPLILCAALVLAVAGCADDPVAAMSFDAAPVAAAGATAEQQPSQKVEELVAPIALYPDVLVAQILAAATQPAEVVHAGLRLDEHRGASAAQLGQVVDGQPWDAGIKALTLLPDVLAVLNRNYAWTVALGEAYAADPADVLRAVQAVRRKAQAAGELASTTELVRVPGGPVSDVSLGDRFTWGWHSWDVDWQHSALMYQDAPYLSARE